MDEPDARPSSAVSSKSLLSRRKALLVGLLAAAGLTASVASAIPVRTTLLASDSDHEREHCEDFYVHLVRTDCVRGRYMATFEKRCAECGGLCPQATFTTDEGPC